METQNSNNHEENIFHVLENWDKKSVPDFFETRILSKISSSKSIKKTKFNWAFLTIIIIINCFVGVKAIQSNFTNSAQNQENVYSEYLESTNYYNQYYSQEL